MAACTPTRPPIASHTCQQTVMCCNVTPMSRSWATAILCAQWSLRPLADAQAPLPTRQPQQQQQQQQQRLASAGNPMLFSRTLQRQQKEGVGLTSTQEAALRAAAAASLVLSEGQARS